MIRALPFLLLLALACTAADPPPPSPTDDLPGVGPVAPSRFEICAACPAVVAEPPRHCAGLDPPTELQAKRITLAAGLFRAALTRDEQYYPLLETTIAMAVAAAQCDLGGVALMVPALCRQIECGEDTETMPDEWFRPSASRATGTVLEHHVISLARSPEALARVLRSETFKLPPAPGRWTEAAIQTGEAAELVPRARIAMLVLSTTWPQTPRKRRERQVAQIAAVTKAITGATKMTR